MNMMLKDRLRLASVGLLLFGFVIIGISGVIPPTAYDPSTQIYRDAKQPIQIQILLYEHRYTCWILSGVCFAAAAVLALIVRWKKNGNANPTS